MDAIGAYRSFFAHRNWPALLGVGTLLAGVGSVVPVLPAALWCGYVGRMLHLERRGATSDEVRVDSASLADTFVLGLKGAVVLLLWFLPVLFVVGVGVGAVTIALLTGSLVLLDGDASPAAVPWMLVAFAFTVLVFVLVFFAIATVPAQVACARTLMTGELAEGLRIDAVLGTLRRTRAEFLGGALVHALLMLLVCLVGALACGVGLFAAHALIAFVALRFAVSLHDLAVERGEPPLTRAEA